MGRDIPWRSDLPCDDGTDILASDDEMRELAHDYFTHPKAQARAKKILGELQLDETSVEAESIRTLAPELEAFHRMLAMVDARRNRSLRLIGESRASLAKRLEETSNTLIGQASHLIEDDAATQSSD